MPVHLIRLTLILLAMGGIALGLRSKQQQGEPPQQRAQKTLTVEIDYGPAKRETTRSPVVYTPGMTALDALQAAADVTFTEADPTHPKAIDGINGVRTDLERSRFWMLDVAGKHAQKSPQDIRVRPGITVRLAYMVPPVKVTIDYGPAGLPAEEELVDFEPGMNALEALQAAADVKLTRVDPTHPEAVDSVNGVRTDLAEGRFWSLDVNGKHAQKMPQDIELGAGFEVRWSYVIPPVTVKIDFGPVERAPLELQVPFRKGMTALSALQEAARVELTQADPRHPKAVDSIDGVGTDLERGWFWLYDVNGQHPKAMADQVKLKAGFEVEWRLSAPEDGGARRVAERPSDPETTDRPSDHGTDEQQEQQEQVTPAQTKGLAGALGSTK